MKTAEEWSMQTDFDGTRISPEFIAKVQLDAWKQGMTDAALVVEHHHEYPSNREYALIQDINEHRDVKVNL